MKRAALIAGNNSYADPEIMNLRYAEKDALELLKEETARAVVHRVFFLDAYRSNLLVGDPSGSYQGFADEQGLCDLAGQPAEEG